MSILHIVSLAVKAPFEAIVGKKRKARFSTVPLGHVARMATSTGLSVDSVCVSVRAECYVSKWGTAKLLTQP